MAGTGAKFRPFTDEPTGKRRSRKRAIVWTCPEDHMVAYLRVSTQEQAESHAGLDAQKTIIAGMAALRGWTIIEWRIDPGESGKSLHRPALLAALEDVRSGRARGIVVAKLDRLSRSVLDFALLLKEAMAVGWNVVALDLGVDLSTPAGKMIANIVMTIAEWEREVIGQRTKDGLAAKRAAGVRLGRPRVASDVLLDLVLDAFAAEGGYAAAARRLMADGVQTPHGSATWYPATVRQMTRSQDGQARSTALSA